MADDKNTRLTVAQKIAVPFLALAGVVVGPVVAIACALWDRLVPGRPSVLLSAEKAMNHLAPEK